MRAPGGQGPSARDSGGPGWRADGILARRFGAERLAGLGLERATLGKAKFARAGFERGELGEKGSEGRFPGEAGARARSRACCPSRPERVPIPRPRQVHARLKLSASRPVRAKGSGQALMPPPWPWPSQGAEASFKLGRAIPLAGKVFPAKTASGFDINPSIKANA